MKNILSFIKNPATALKLEKNYIISATTKISDYKDSRVVMEYVNNLFRL
ncbi:hypothetical protein Bcsk_001930 [Bartonella sp. CDC_skunk]|uniref:Uncharacterized protein n=1 Tax=Bartonella rochalimae ATCC BAA-1498 TaxID=685782 RepID=E6YK83_9HYPH|nr:hypothetical protein BA1379B_000850 [Bartonella sp. A1379B]AQX20857.1 hypothetical protein Bcsk_001930 [Bartonella sp. CDC_skunk]AQX22449.1 hypothetical protein Bho11B_004230 [Bartonella sp. 11B]AQX24270.1 hypothetical protein Bho114_009550 [Bartonella sp. 114]AQX24897.1 hypothetical protein Bco22_001960 [Bartonella sp. Coyote22sub2]AQX26112.1 hypothetical protein Bra60_000860 [Bartonella sp. Raccoon60]KEC57477.1 hypothetical protein O99_00125 [Bartonella rochalimae ATCC BAA-1498]